MRLLTRATLNTFATEHPDSAPSLARWIKNCEAAAWVAPIDIKTFDARASFVGTERVVFNMSGNKYRLIVRISYAYQAVYVCFVGTHAEYDKVDAATITIKP